MTPYRDALPQLECSFDLPDAGLETDLIFNHGIELRGFAGHIVFEDPPASLSPSIKSKVASGEVARDVKLRFCRTVRSTPVVQNMQGGLT